MKKILSVFLSVFVLLCAISMIPEVKAERFFADNYNGSTYEGTETETILYTSKADNEINIEGGLPKYYNQGTYHNTCANVAGAILLGYYDKDYDELISDFKAARIIRDKVMFASQTEAVQRVIDSLYMKMNTNNGGNGTTIEWFKRGLRNYIEGVGRNVQLTSIISKGNINYDKYSNAINAKQPIVLFASKYTLVSLRGIKELEGRDDYVKLYYGGDHVLVGYGIREINYYDQQGRLKKQVNCLMAATGYEQDQLAYILLDDRINLVDGYIVNIY